MTFFRLLPGLALVALACSGPRPAVEADAPAESAAPWPMVNGGPGRNMVSPAKGLPTEWSVKEGEQKNIKWSAQVGTRGYTGPVVAGGKVYVATNNGQPRDPAVKGNKAVLMCFRESDGQFLWQLAHDMPPAEVTQRQADQDGLIYSPTVDGDLLYYLTPAAVLVCASTEGKVGWQYDMMKELKVFPCFCAASSPLVVGDRVFVVTGNGRDGENELPSPDAPSFAAFDKKTGKLLWKDSSPGKNVLDGQWTSPAYAEVQGKGQIIFPGGDGWLYAFEPESGKLIWKFDCNPKDSEFKPGGRGTRNYVVAAPVVWENKVYVGVGQNPDHGAGVGHFWCINATKTGDISPSGDNFDPKAEANKNSGLVWHFGGFVQPRPKLGRDILFGRTVSTAAVQDGLAFVVDLEGYVYCFDARTGQKHWDYDMKAGVWGSPLVADGKIYVGTDDAEVNILPAGKAKPKKEDVVKIEMERAIKAPVVVANGTLYVLTDTTLYAVGKK